MCPPCSGCPAPKENIKWTSGSECALRAPWRLINGKFMVKIYIHVIMERLNVCTYEVWMRENASGTSEFGMSEFAGS